MGVWKMLEFYNLRSDEITPKDVIAIVKKWWWRLLSDWINGHADAKKFSLSATDGVRRWIT